MPRISMSGQEKSNHDWKEIQNLILENLFESIPEEVEHIKDEVNKILEEAKKNVCETDGQESN